MTMTRMQMFACTCCMIVPMSLLAQNNSSDPGNGTVSPTGQSAPSATSGQTTPGVAQTRQTQNSTFTSESAGTGADSNAQMMKDKMFLKEASQGGMAEVQLGQLASEKAANPQVKAFGQKMVTDHTMLNNDLKPFADRMGVPPPADVKPGDKAEMDKLNGLSGADFDKEYIAYMMKDHQEDLKEFRKEAASAGDPELKAAVEKGEKVIAQHHRMVDKLGASLGVTATM